MKPGDLRIEARAPYASVGDEMTKRAFAAAVTTICAALVFTTVALAWSQAATVAVTAGKPSEFRFTLSKRSVAKGVVVFTVTNRGKLRHDFKIAGKKTLLVAPSKRSTLKVTLKRAGRVPYLCTVPGHAAAGMKGTLVVK